MVKQIEAVLTLTKLQQTATSLAEETAVYLQHNNCFK